MHKYWDRPEHTDSVNTARLLLSRSGASAAPTLTVAQDERLWWWRQADSSPTTTTTTSLQGRRVVSSSRHGHTAFVDVICEVPGASSGPRWGCT
jgi:hypothetical protein